MPLEKYEYPATGAVTASFTPTFDAVRGPVYTVDEGILADQSSGKKQYLYEEGVRFKLWERNYANPKADLTSYESFRDTVAGDTFKFTDYDATAHTVTFIPTPREVVMLGNGRFGWRAVMREEL